VIFSFKSLLLLVPVRMTQGLGDDNSTAGRLRMFIYGILNLGRGIWTEAPENVLCDVLTLLAWVKKKDRDIPYKIATIYKNLPHMSYRQVKREHK